MFPLAGHGQGSSPSSASLRSHVRTGLLDAMRMIASGCLIVSRHVSPSQMAAVIKRRLCRYSNFAGTKETEEARSSGCPEHSAWGDLSPRPLKTPLDGNPHPSIAGHRG